MSAETDRNDRGTLAAIGRHPGCKRKDFFVNKAAVTRLIAAGLVEPPTTAGKLYLTPGGEAALARKEQ